MSGYAAYNFGTSARKLDQQRDMRLQVVPGGERQRQLQGVPAIITSAVRVLAIVVAVFAVVGAVRITLASMTVTSALEYRELSTAIDTARSEGSALELEKSTLSNPERIKEQAVEIGMLSPDDTTFLDLSGDIVVTDEAGNLSLSGSLAAAAAADEAAAAAASAM